MPNFKKLNDTLESCRAIFNQDDRLNNGCYRKAPFEIALLDLVGVFTQVVSNQAALDRQIKQLKRSTGSKAVKTPKTLKRES